jgi:hypothetical protein
VRRDCWPDNELHSEAFQRSVLDVLALRSNSVRMVLPHPYEHTSVVLSRAINLTLFQSVSLMIGEEVIRPSSYAKIIPKVSINVTALLASDLNRAAPSH